MRLLAVMVLAAAPCTVPKPPPETSPAADCKAELRLVAERVEPCRWVWRCAGVGPAGQPVWLPFKSGAVEPGCTTAVF